MVSGIDFTPRWTLTETIDDLISRERDGVSSYTSRTASLADAA
jgi:hypothetical protein